MPKYEYDILIRNAIIITNDDIGIIECGEVGIIGDHIAYVASKPQKESTAAHVIEGKDMVVMPGLVNAHTHTGMSILRSFGDDMPLWDWLTKIIWPAEDMLNGKDIYWSCMLSIAEMIMSGTTCFADMYFFMEDVAKAVQQTGVRALLARGLQDNDGKGELRLKENEILFREYDSVSNGRLKIALGPHAPYTCSMPYLNRIADTACKLGCKIHIHLSETEKEVRESIQEFGRSPIRYALDSGIFASDTIAAHCVNVSDHDIDILKNSKANVVYNPSSNFKLSSGFAPVNKFMEKGINICLGTDSAASNNNLNMFEEMHIASLVNKVLCGDPTAIDAKTALNMVTINGAAALGFERSGRIKEGWKADIILIDMNSPHMYPRNNIVSNIVYSAQASDVHTVIVDGGILMENRQFKKIDLERVYFEIEKIRERLNENR
ncbi:MAG: amidohydrolase [Clostridia bacterium]|nr:amidohydrolase [Clostridia bacterium]